MPPIVIIPYHNKTFYTAQCHAITTETVNELLERVNESEFLPPNIPAFTNMFIIGAIIERLDNEERIKGCYLQTFLATTEKEGLKLKDIPLEYRGRRPLIIKHFGGSCKRTMKQH